MSVNMTEGEKARLDRVVVGYMEMKPVRSVSAISLLRARFDIVTLRRAVVLGLIGLVAFSGTLSYAAEGALPGDTLYGVKVGINEELRAVLAVSPLAQAVWSAARAERRLDEAVKLARADKLTTEVNAMLMTAFAVHAEEAVQNVEALRVEDAPAAISIASRFETRVSAHQALLADMLVRLGDTRIEEVIQEKAAAIAAVRASAEGEVQVASVPTTIEATALVDASVAEGQRSAAMAANAAAMKELGVAKQLFGLASPTLAPAESERVSADISTATDALSDGDALFAAGNYNGAFHEYQKAQASADQLSVFLKAAFELHIRVLPLSL